jgi:hypothetical protein
MAKRITGLIGSLAGSTDPQLAIEGEAPRERGYFLRLRQNEAVRELRISLPVAAFVRER